METKSGTRGALAAVALTVLCVVIAFQAGWLDPLIATRVATGKLDKPVIQRIEQGALDDRMGPSLNRTARDQGEWINHWCGVEIRQYPNDLQLYQDIIFETKPDVIIESGTYAGGLTLYLAMLLDVINPKGKVITIDIFSEHWDESVAKLDLPAEQKSKLLDRIHFLKGSSTSPEIAKQIAELIPPQAKVLVLLDSLHTKEHVLNELKIYSKLVTPNSYLIVNDTDIDGIVYTEDPKDKLKYPFIGQVMGVKAAMDEWLPTADNYVVDTKRERFVVSCAHSGFLKRTK